MRVGILTSGGDAPGMNASIRAVIRAAERRDWEVFGIHDGFHGLLHGVPQRVDWTSPVWSLREGGTFLRSARSPEFVANVELRRESVRRLREDTGLDALIVIGGDGSMSGALEISRLGLRTIGVPGSIDNDIAGTDMSIGVDTALNTIVDAVDRLRDTIFSHSRVAVVEVMGRQTGYLATMAALACGADKVFVPEQMPGAPQVTHEELGATIELLAQRYESPYDRRGAILVVAEGASHTSRYIEETFQQSERYHREARATILGHLQRGGAPSAFDRLLGFRLGVHAVEALAEGIEGQMVGLSGGSLVLNPLEAVLEGSREIRRGIPSPNLQDSYELCRRLVEPPPMPGVGKVAILTSGLNVPGMNVAIRAFVREILQRRLVPVGVRSGFQGLSATEGLHDLTWQDVSMEKALRSGGSLLGTSEPRDLPSLGTMAATLKGAQVRGLVVIGDSPGLKVAHDLYNHMAGRMPVAFIPAAITGQVGSAAFSIGFDTALNTLVEFIDRAVDYGNAVGRPLVTQLVEPGCDLLALACGLGGGAELAFTDQECPDVAKAMERLRYAVASGIRSPYAIIITSKAREGDIEAIREASKQGLGLDVVIDSPGYVMRGGRPSAFDRILATKLGTEAARVMHDAVGRGQRAMALISLEGKRIGARDYLGSEAEDAQRAKVRAELARCFDLTALPAPNIIKRWQQRRRAPT